MIHNLHQYFQKNIHIIQKKNNGNKNNKKTFSIKIKEDVGMSKPKKHAKEVGRANIGPKIKQTTSIQPYISTALCILLYSGVSTCVGLYGSGLFNFGSYVSSPNLLRMLFCFDIPTSSFIFIENVFYYS